MHNDFEDMSKYIAYGIGNILFGGIMFYFGAKDARNNRWTSQDKTKQQRLLTGFGTSTILTGFTDLGMIYVFKHAPEEIIPLNPGMILGYTWGYYMFSRNKDEPPKEPPVKRMIGSISRIKIPSFGVPQPLRTYSAELPDETELGV